MDDIYRYKLAKYATKSKKLKEGGTNIHFSNPVPISSTSPTDHINGEFTLPSITYTDRTILTSNDSTPPYILQTCTIHPLNHKNPTYLYHGALHNIFNMNHLGITFFAFDPLDSVNILCEKNSLPPTLPGGIFKFKIINDIPNIAIIVDNLDDIAKTLNVPIQYIGIQDSKAEAYKENILATTLHQSRGWSGRGPRSAGARRRRGARAAHTAPGSALRPAAAGRAPRPAGAPRC